MAYVIRPGRTKGRSKPAIGPQKSPIAKTPMKTFRTSGARRVTADDAAIRLARQEEPERVYTTKTRSTRKRLRTDKRGNTIQTEFIPEREKEHINKVMGNANTHVDEKHPQTRFIIGPAIFNASFSPGSHETKNYAAPIASQNVNIYPPVDEFIELKQTGKNTLKTIFKDQPNNKFRSTFRGIGYAENEMNIRDSLPSDINTMTMPLKSTCGYNRTGVFNPLAFVDWGEIASSDARQNWFTGAQNRWACGAKWAILHVMTKVILEWYEAAGVDPLPSENTIIGYLTDYATGMSSSSSLTFPLQEINDTYTFRNENSLTPCFISLYHCTPKKRLGKRHNPITDWYDFQLGGGVSMDLTSKTEAIKADSTLAFPPEFSQYSDNFATVTKDSATNQASVSSIDTSKYQNITAISTEVVPQNTPFQSQQFRNNWDVINNKKIVLQPGQELKIHVKVKFARPIDIREVLLGDANHYFESLTYYPIIKFWGVNDVAQIKPKHNASSDFQYNRLREIVKSASSPCLLVASKTSEITVAGKMPPEMKTNYSQQASFIWLNNFFGQFIGTKRELSSPFLNYAEYGVNEPWASVNNNYMLLGIKQTDVNPTGGINPAVKTYFGFKLANITTDFNSLTTSSIQGYLAQDVFNLATIVQETDVKAQLVSPALDGNFQ